MDFYNRNIFSQNILNFIITVNLSKFSKSLIFELPCSSFPPLPNCGDGIGVGGGNGIIQGWSEGGSTNSSWTPVFQGNILVSLPILSTSVLMIFGFNILTVAPTTKCLLVDSSASNSLKAILSPIIKPLGLFCKIFTKSLVFSPICMASRVVAIVNWSLDVSKLSQMSVNFCHTYNW